MTNPLEDRLRRSMTAVADLPMGQLRIVPTGHRPHRPVIALTAVLVAAGVALAIAVGAVGSSGQTVNVGSTPAVRLPVPHGRLEPLFRSSDVDDLFRGPARLALVSTHALRVGDFDFTLQETLRQGQWTTWINHGGGGSVVDTRQGEDTDRNLVVGAGEPTVWVGLPADVAVVTYTYEGRTVWQRPLYGTAAFLHPVAVTMRDTPRATEHLASYPPYDPLLRAYDSDGRLVSAFVVYVEGPLTGLTDVPAAGNRATTTTRTTVRR